MPPTKSVKEAIKRKATDLLTPTSNKKARPANDEKYKDSSKEEEYGIVLRQFYPPEMTNARALAYKNNEVERPIETLEKAMSETKDARGQVEVKDAVVHYFKADLRTTDNKSLHLASERAKSKGVPLIAIFLISPQDWQAHITSAVRVDFVLRTLEVLKQDLARLNIPLYIETVEKRKRVPDRVMELCEEWGASHIYANIEYEVDELRREALLTRKCLEKGIAFTAVPDTCIVAPGELSSQTGGQFAVYSPWYRAWVRYLEADPSHLDGYSQPSVNPSSAREKFSKLFDAQVPDAPAGKQLSEEEKKRFRSMWPPGEHEAVERLGKFISQKVKSYKEKRNLPGDNGTAVLSVHFASGTLAARTAVREVRNANSAKTLDGGNPGNASWMSEVAWRDFYKHVLAHWPYIW